MKLRMKDNRTIYTLLLALLLASSFVSCNKKDNNSDNSFAYATTSTSSALVSSFSLKVNADVMANLDSVYFSIDPERGVIYNADSLPVGTNVSALKVTVGFRSPVSKAVFTVLDSDNGTTTYEYSSNSSDALDFRYGVKLAVTSADGQNVKTYDVKVNVHKVEPDSIVWPLSARRNLPGAADDNLSVGIASHNNKYWCLLHHNGGFVMSHAETPAGPWTSTLLDDFDAAPATLESADDKLFVLRTDGQLLCSTDGLNWDAVGDVHWTDILGSYEDRLLGLKTDADGKTTFDEYPRRDGFEPTAVDSDFPIKHHSQLLTSVSSWSVAPQAIMVGGLKADGTPSNATWAFDGSRWAKINSTSSLLPALDGPTLLSYFTHTIEVPSLKVSRRESWMVMGGRLKDGTINTTTYVSNNRGITWGRAASSLSQSPAMPPFYCAQAMVHTATLTKGAITWDCPYIYIVGGRSSDGTLYNNIWQGVLPRLTFPPLK